MPGVCLKVSGGLKRAKTSKYDQITWIYLLKTLNQKLLGGKKFIYINQGYQFKKKKFEIKAKKIFGLKKAYFFWVTLIQAIVTIFLFVQIEVSLN